MVGVKDLLKNNDLKAEFGTWFSFFNGFMFDTPYFNKLKDHIHNERVLNIVYPHVDDTFKCFKETNINSLKVVILGSEPHIDGTSNGMSMGMDEYNINKRTIQQDEVIRSAIEKDLNILSFTSPTMESIANQGVLFLNSALTTIKNAKSSHGIFWRLFTKYTLIELSKQNTGIIYVLLGKKANSFKKYINENSNYIFSYEHPEDIKKGDKWDCDMFSKINQILLENNGKEYCIDWR